MRIFWSTLSLLSSLLLLAAAAAAEDYETPHQRAFACLGNPEMIFADDPADCDAVCKVCHAGETVTSGDAAVSFTLSYTLAFNEAVASLSAADLNIAGGELVAGSLLQLDASTWTFKVNPTGSVSDVAVSLKNGKSPVVTRKLVAGRIIEGQSQNPEMLWTDMVYPGLYPNVSSRPLSSSNTPEQNWEALPALHKICKECHPTQSEPLHNHPMFVKMAVDFGNGNTEEMGLLLCTTCHDPHSNKSALLRMENTGSQLCQYCHGK